MRDIDVLYFKTQETINEPFRVIHTASVPSVGDTMVVDGVSYKVVSVNYDVEHSVIAILMDHGITGDGHKVGKAAAEMPMNNSGAKKLSIDYINGALKEKPWLLESDVAALTGIAVQTIEEGRSEESSRVFTAAELDNISRAIMSVSGATSRLIDKDTNTVERTIDFIDNRGEHTYILHGTAKQRWFSIFETEKDLEEWYTTNCEEREEDMDIMSYEDAMEDDCHVEEIPPGQTPREHGEIIFDKNGTAIGIAICPIQVGSSTIIETEVLVLDDDGYISIIKDEEEAEDILEDEEEGLLEIPNVANEEQEAYLMGQQAYEELVRMMNTSNRTQLPLPGMDSIVQAGEVFVGEPNDPTTQALIAESIMEVIQKQVEEAHKRSLRKRPTVEEFISQLEEACREEDTEKLEPVDLFTMAKEHKHRDLFQLCTTEDDKKEMHSLINELSEIGATANYIPEEMTIVISHTDIGMKTVCNALLPRKIGPINTVHRMA